MTFSALGRLIWPEKKTLFLTSGLAVALMADVISFLGNLGSPIVLIWPALGFAAVFAFLCLPHLSKEGVDGAECRECGALRLLLYAIIALGLLILAGQGTSATERIGAQLGLIQRDVSAIRDDVSAIREVTADAEIIRNPRTAADRFHNAWLYANYRRDGQNAWSALQDLYEHGGVNKIDAAELYFTTGLPLMPRDQLIAQMIEVGRQRRDAPMLVVSARQVATPEEAAALMAEARAIDPDLAFAYWDQGVNQTELHDGSADDRLRRAREDVAELEAFLAAAQRRRVPDYFFVPQHQADWEALVSQNLQRQRDRLQRLEERAARRR